MLHDGNKSLEQDAKGETSEGVNSTTLLCPGRSNSKGIDFVTSCDFGNYQPSILSHTGMRRSPIAGRRSNLNLNMGESSLVPKTNGGTMHENMTSNNNINNNINNSLNHLCEFLPLKDKEGIHENMKEKSFSGTIGPTYKNPFTTTTNMNDPKGPKVPTVKALIGKFSLSQLTKHVILNLTSIII
jgi:hypothetical protein